MDEARMNHYEKQLYTVFKTFDVDNEEALDRAAVLQLCDALQLEARGAVLADSLFERRTERVTFATFRNGLLNVLGASPAAPASAAAAAPAHSDDDSSGREVAPKFVFGSKKYGRRSRPSRGGDEPAAPRAASASRVDADADAARRPRMRYKRSASAMEGRAGVDCLDHDRRIDCAEAVTLCRDLQMDGIDPRLVERIFEDAPNDMTTVGEFFDRLNAALTCIASTGDGTPQPASPAAAPADEDEAEPSVPGETVVEAWELAGVRRPRRLLAELGFSSAALRPAELERALDAELRALGPPPEDQRDARPLLQLAALATTRLRLGRSRAGAAAAVAERDKLRADLAEANRRAQLLAQDVDENHARLEAERQAAMRQLEAKHAETARAAAEEWAAERERAASARAALEAEATRRQEAETRLRAELATLSARIEEYERLATAAEERAAAAERERARAEEEARAAAARGGSAARQERAAARALAGQVRELREHNASLRDRADELLAALEARAPGASLPTRPADTSWRDEAQLETEELLSSDRIEDCGSSPASIEQKLMSELQQEGEPAGAGAGRADAAAQTEAPGETDSLRAQIDELCRKHEAEKVDLNNLIAELEGALEALREELERGEEYWAGKLAGERAAAAEEAAAADERLAELLRRVHEYERAFRPRLPPLHEAALEPQYRQLEQEFEEYKAAAARELAEARAAGERPASCSCHQRSGRARAGGGGGGERGADHAGDGDAPSGPGGPRRPPPPTGAGWALRARAAHAERAAARLLARLHAADTLVAELYRENCSLQHARAPRLA